MSDYDYRDITFEIFLEDNFKSKPAIDSIIKSINQLGLETVYHTTWTNLITTTAQIPDKDDHTLEERVLQIRKIPGIKNVRVGSGNRHIFRSIKENISLHDNVSAVINRFSESNAINVEETLNNYTNNSRIQISAGHESSIVIQQNVIYKLDDKSASIQPSPIIISQLESLKQKLEENKNLSEEEKTKFIRLINKIKSNLSNTESVDDNHRDLKWAITSSMAAFAIILEVIKILLGD